MTVALSSLAVNLASALDRPTLAVGATTRWRQWRPLTRAVVSPPSRSCSRSDSRACGTESERSDVSTCNRVARRSAVFYNNPNTWRTQEESLCTASPPGCSFSSHKSSHTSASCWPLSGLAMATRCAGST